MNENKQIILIVATAWGPKLGGINSFNRKFCIGIANYIKERKLDYKLVCVVMNCNKEESNDAWKYDIRLLELNDGEQKAEFTGEKYVVKLLNELPKSDEENVKYVILHDIKTGDLINYRDKFFQKATWIAIHHMHYEKYAHLLGYKNVDAKQKAIDDQFNLFSKVDKVFAVGPKLKEMMQNSLDEKATTISVIEIMPGIDFPEQNIINPNIEKKISGLSFGRVDIEHDPIKMSSLAVDGWVKATNKTRRNDKNYVMQVVGFDFSDDKDIKYCEMIEKKYSGKIKTLRYKTNQKEIDSILKNTTIAFMLSRHEGFGLTGWEAIGAGIPLILSKNTGVWKFLEAYGEGKFSKYILSIDMNEKKIADGKNPYTKKELDQVVNAIKKYFANPKFYHDLAREMRSELKEKYTWENTAKKFLEDVGVNFGVSKQKKKVYNEKEKELSIPDFANECVNNNHALILSHRTNIIEMKDAETYRLFRPFLNKFSFEKNNIINCNSGLNRTLLIFIIDFGGDYKDNFDEQALYNCLTLQSTLKAICLVPPFGQKRALHGDNVPTEIIRYHSHSINLETNEQEYFAHDLLLNVLSNRTVIIVKNYKNYIEGLESLYHKISTDVSKYRFEKLISNGVSLISCEDKNIPTIDLNSSYILMDYIPYLDHLSNDNKEKIEKECTNIRNETDRAFGLYATIKFDNFNENKLKHVDIYSINRQTQKCSKIKMHNKPYEEGDKRTLFNAEIEKSMRYVTMSAAYFLEKLYWKDEIRNKYWPDFQDRNNDFSGAYYAIEKIGFHHLTLPQFLNIPIMFPEIIDEIKKKNT